MNFIEKKFIPRRTFIRGAGVILGLPLLDSMIPAQTPLKETAAVPVRRFHGHLASARRRAGILEPAAGRSGFRVFLHHQASGAVSQVRHADQRHGYAGGDGNYRGAWGRPRPRGGSALEHAPAPKCRKPLSWCDCRSTRREEIWPRYDPGIDSACGRGRRQLR